MTACEPPRGLTGVSTPGLSRTRERNLDLPLNKAVSVTVTPKKTGVEPFHCSAMGMGDGKLVVTER